MTKAFNFINSVKHKIELALAFCSGAIVGFSAGVGLKLLDRLLDSGTSPNDKDDVTGISNKKAKTLKREIDSEVNCPNEIT